MKKGDIYSSNNCGYFEVVEYINAKKVRVKFVDTGYESYSTASYIREGAVRDKSVYVIPEGNIYTTMRSGDIEILDSTDNTKIKIRFINTGYERLTTRMSILDGKIKDPYTPLTYGVGYFGEGTFRAKVDNKVTKEYHTWCDMFSRCYNHKNSSYSNYGGKGVTVCKEWHNFQVFASWFTKQPNAGEKGFALDKDLTVIGNKIYSPQACSFVRQHINNLLHFNRKIRGDLPLGVSKPKYCTGYRARCSTHTGEGKEAKLGSFTTPDQAFEAYRTYKESLIQKVAKEEYLLGNITEVVYNNLMTYEVVPYPI